MGNLFGKEVPLPELIKENKRIVNRAIRELDRERTRMEREEKKLIADIKKMAAEGQTSCSYPSERTCPHAQFHHQVSSNASTP